MPAGLIVLGLILVIIGSIAVRARRRVTVYAPNVALMYRDGAFAQELQPGRHGWFDLFKRVQVFTVSRAETPQQIGELTVMSKDQFSFRLGVATVATVVDPRIYHESLGVVGGSAQGSYLFQLSHHPALQPTTAMAAVAVVGRHVLAEIVADPKAVADALMQRMNDEGIPGCEITKVLVTSINLPPETRKMFTDVERAKMEGLAAVERARGEHAALRVLANAARLAKDNPELANLRLLQTIESSKGSTTIILGNPPSFSPHTAPTNG